MHCILLLSDRSREPTKRFLDRFGAVFPNADTSQRNWTVMREPRACAFGPLSWEQWRWHVLIDLHGMPPEVERIVAGTFAHDATRALIQEHQMAVMLFLMSGPEEASPLDQLRSLCKVAWCWFDVGADVFIWPRGQVSWRASEIRHLSPENLDHDDILYFTSYGVAGDGEGGQYWRSWGLGAFGLPDLVCVVRNAEDQQIADVLFRSLIPYVMQLGGPLRDGDEVELPSPTENGQSSAWRVAQAPQLESLHFLRSPYGVQLLTRADQPIG
ncbi:MAG: hypothetical protein KatS3mg105_2092 [Gemmatales bacterium]|nr:MAG: hypothetical protein KatS3mg105_2092 [Gemmatales bacterium]